MISQIMRKIVFLLKNCLNIQYTQFVIFSNLSGWDILNAIDFLLGQLFSIGLNVQQTLNNIYANIISHVSSSIQTNLNHKVAI